MPVITETIYVNKSGDAQLTLSSNYLEETVILEISSPIQDFRPTYLELPATDLEPLIQHLSAIYAELVVETQEGPQNN